MIPDKATPPAVRERIESTITEIEWLIDCGATTQRIASAVGKTPCALYRWLYRHDRPDLARTYCYPGREQTRRAA